MIATGAQAVIRDFRVQEIDAVVDVYRDSVRSLGPLAYAPLQVKMWATHPTCVAEFCQRLTQGKTLVVEADRRLIAFAQLSPSDHLAFLYCRGSEARRGWCSRLYRLLEHEAREAGVRQLHTEASHLSRPFFQKFGFVVDSPEIVTCLGVAFERFRMSKDLEHTAPLPLSASASESQLSSV